MSLKVGLLENEELNLRKIGISDLEAELLDYINNALRDIINKINEGDLIARVKNCKELLKLCIAIKQDILGDFPYTLLIINHELWELLLRAFEISCCCEKTYNFLRPSLKESFNSFDDDEFKFSYSEDRKSISRYKNNNNSIISNCCIVLKEGILDLLIEMVKNTNKLLEFICSSYFGNDELERYILRLTNIVIPNVVSCTIKNSLMAHCECKVESIISISNIINVEKALYFSENWMRELRLWTNLFKLLNICCEFNNNVLRLYDLKHSIEVVNSQIPLIDFSVNNLRLLDSAQRLCTVLTKINHSGELKGIKYYVLLAFGDIFSLFIKYISNIYRIVYFGDYDTCIKKLDFLLTQKFDSVIDEDDYTTNSYLSNRDNNKNLDKDKVDNLKYKHNFNRKPKTNSLISCLTFLLGDENIIEVDSLRSDYQSTFRSTIINLLETLFQNKDLTSLDSVTMTNQTLSVYDYINNFLVNELDLNNIDENFNFTHEGYIERFIKSPNHTVSLLIFLLKSDYPKFKIQRSLNFVFDSLFNLKNSPFENLVPITLNHLFSYLISMDINPNISLLFVSLKERVSNDSIHVFSPLIWISKILILEKVFSEKDDTIFFSINSFLDEWKKNSIVDYIQSPIQCYDHSKLNEIQRCIMLCSIYSKSTQLIFDSSINDLDFISILFGFFKKDKNLRKSATLLLMEFLSKNHNFPKDKFEVEVIVDDRNKIERFWQINTQHLFLKYFELIEMDFNGQVERDSENEGNNEDLLFKNEIDESCEQDINLSVLKTPNVSQLSKMLSIIKNSRIQTQIKISAISSLTILLTSSKITNQIFYLYLDEVINILILMKCQRYYLDTYKEDENSSIDNQIFSEVLNCPTVYGITEIIYQEEDSVFYHLSVALNAIIISRSYKKEIIEYIVNNYSMMLIHHLSFWLFSSSEECRCGSSALLSTLLILILKVGLIKDSSKFDLSNEIELNKTSINLSIFPFIHELLIIPTSIKILKDLAGQNTQINKSSEFHELNLEKNFSYSTSVFETVDKIIEDLNRLFQRKSGESDQLYIEEILFSIFSISFPWTNLTTYAVQYDTSIKQIKESIDSIFSKLIMLLNSNISEFGNSFENYMILMDIKSQNIDMKLLAILKIILILLNAFYHMNSSIFMDLVSKFLTYFIIISSFFDNYFREKDHDQIGPIKPTISLGIFDTFSICLESFDGAVSNLFFETLPENIHWSFIVLQVPKLIDPLNPVSTPMSLLLVARLLSRMPVKRWLEEDSRYTAKCLKLLLSNKRLLFNRELTDINNVQTFQESSYIKYLLDIFEKISISNIPNHPLNLFIQKNLLRWLHVIGFISSSYVIQTRIWNLKLILLDKWDIEYSENIYSIVSNFRIFEDNESDIYKKITWGYISSYSIKVLTSLIKKLDFEKDKANFSMDWRSKEFCDYFVSVLRYLDASLSIHFKPIKLSNITNFEEMSHEIELVSTTFNEVLDLLLETFISPFFLLNINWEAELIHNEKKKNLKIFILKLLINFISKLTNYWPFSIRIFKKLAEDTNRLLIFLNSFTQLNLGNTTFYSLIQIIINIIKISPTNSTIFQEKIYSISNKIYIKDMPIDHLIRMVSYYLSLISLEKNNIIISTKMYHKMISFCRNSLEKFSDFISFDQSFNLLSGLLNLYHSLVCSMNMKFNKNEIEYETKMDLIISILIAIYYSSKIAVNIFTKKSFLRMNFIQDLFMISASCLSYFDKNYLDLTDNLILNEELRKYVNSIWNNYNTLINYLNKYNDLSKELETELCLCIDYLLNNITMEIFSTILIGNIISYEPFKFVEEINEQFLYIVNINNSKEYSSYKLIYFLLFLCKIKIHSSKSTDLKEWNKKFNKFSFNLGFLDSIFTKTTNLLVELREVCLGELKIHTVTSIRAKSNQKLFLYSNLKENVFMSKITCLFQLLKIIGLYLSEFEGPINLFTNKKLKPILLFVIESLALFNCVSKQLSAEQELNNPNSFETCLKNWWLYIKKLTKDENDFERFSNIFKQIFSLAICCSSLIIPISDSQITEQSRNAVPLSDITRSQKQASSRLHDLFLHILQTESSIGLKLGIVNNHLPIEIDEENGNLISNVSQLELSRLNGNDLKISRTKGNLWLDSIILNDSVPIFIRCGVLRLLINLALSSSKKKFFKEWKTEEDDNKIKILQILEKARLTKNMEFLTLALIFFNIIIKFNPSTTFNSNKPEKCIYSDKQLESIKLSLDHIKMEIETFQDYQEFIKNYPIIEENLSFHET